MNTVINHYVRINLKGNNEFEVWLVEETFDLGEYLRAEIRWAVECPYNRNGVREKMFWDDKMLDQHPEVLLAHFIEQHGDDWFKKNLRPKFVKTNPVKLENVSANCFLTKIQEYCRKCSECLISKVGINLPT